MKGAAPRSILFACNSNSVRSPMAEALARLRLPGVRIESCGVSAGVLDPYAAKVLAERGVGDPPRAPRNFGDVRARDFDLVVALTPEAAAEARREGAEVEFWEAENPSETIGTEEEVLAAYRRVRDRLDERIDERLVP
ncbi:protein-tyrosine-phosphatase [Parvularcula dongshanensis]|uniref:Protein-tyrosine-phosphatase n=1 Tax=Parvularcula dongshanensis TaxID=1173995 RepID=A0A840I3X7_9PROT|nr:protein-tyrosine-phosphatase [Parvularcula dongshanensis]MBB4659022.1 protein-tyrosine-phosphatase [Parvularcula dongshanensis]